MRHLQGFIGIKCVIRQFLASQDLIVDLIFELLEFLVEVQTEKNRKSTTKTEKYRKNRKTRTLSQIKNLGLVFFRFFSVFLGCNPPRLYLPSLFLDRCEMTNIENAQKIF